MNTSAKLQDLVRAEKTCIFIHFMQYSRKWTAQFEQKLDGQEIKLDVSGETFDEAVDSLYSAVHRVGKGLPSVLPTLLEAPPSNYTPREYRDLDDGVPF